MPPRFYDLPPDHPLFTQGVSFVFRSDPPEEHEPQDESEHEDEQDED
jgi:hypothetical protein